MATIRPSLSRLGAACVELQCCGILRGLRNPAHNVGSSCSKRTLGICGLLFKSNRRSYFPQSLYSGVYRGTVDYRPRGSVRGPGCLNFQGFHTVARNGRSGASSGNHVLRVPTLGESITEGTVVAWRRGVGSVVEAEEVVCVLETDKVSVDIHADIPGRIVSIAVDVGGTAFVGGDLAVIEPLSPETFCASGSVPPPGKPPSPAQSVSGPPPLKPDFNDANNSAVAAKLLPRHGLRKPLILFRSIRNRLKALRNLPCEQQVGSPIGSSSHKEEKLKIERAGSTTAVLRYNGLEDLPVFLERPALSADEIEAINDGGVANLDAVAKAWRLSLSFHPVPATKKPTKSSKDKRASA